MTEQQPYPTREQIAEVASNHVTYTTIWANGTGSRGWKCSCGVHNWGTAEENPTRYQEYETRKKATMAAAEHVADAVLALFPQPAPSVERGVSTCYDTTPHLPHRGDRGIGDEPDITWVPLRCDGVPAEPPSIADMAPGTELTEGVRWSVGRDRNGNTFLYRNANGFAQMCLPDDLAPSTIRDVTPPEDAA
jgi:hypothetical protein